MLLPKAYVRIAEGSCKFISACLICKSLVPGSLCRPSGEVVTSKVSSMEEEVDVVLKADNLNQSYSNQQEIIRTVYLVTSNRTFY